MRNTYVEPVKGEFGDMMTSFRQWKTLAACLDNFSEARKMIGFTGKWELPVFSEMTDDEKREGKLVIDAFIARLKLLPRKSKA